MKAFVFSFLVCVFTLNTLMAQDSIPPKFAKKNNFSGFHVGGTTGIGFSYRHEFGKFGIQLSGLPTGEKRNYTILGGLQLMYRFYSSPNEAVNLFTYLGNSFIYNKCYDCICYCNDFQPPNPYVSLFQWNAGIGTGMDIRLSNILSLEVLLGYGIYDFTDWYRFNVDGGLGIFFRF